MPFADHLALLHILTNWESLEGVLRQDITLSGYLYTRRLNLKNSDDSISSHTTERQCVHIQVLRSSLVPAFDKYEKVSDYTRTRALGTYTLDLSTKYWYLYLTFSQFVFLNSAL